MYSFGNNNGTLGHKDTNNILTPTKIKDFPKIKGISTGQAHNLVLKQDSTIDSSTASFDKNVIEQKDILVTIDWNGNTLASITNGTTPLIEGTDYSVDGNIVTIRKAYLATLPIGITELDFGFSAGELQYLEIDISDTIPALSSDADLTDLRVDGSTVTGFSPASLGPYLMNIPYAQTTVTVAYTTSNPYATVQVVNDMNLSIGNNVITVTVTAQNGHAKAYLIEVIRAAAPRGGGGAGGSVLSSNADLRNIQIWVGVQKLTLNLPFSPETTEYTIHTEAKQIEISMMKADSAAEILEGDGTIANNSFVDLVEGENILVLTVRAANGTEKKYTLHIYRETSHLNEHEVPKESETTELVLTDIGGHWAEQDIKRAVAKGIVDGYPDNTFKPNNPITRAEFTLMMINTMGLDGEEANLEFTDNENISVWAKQAVARAVQAGIVNGYEDGWFRPNESITRAEMASMIARTLNVSYDANTRTGFVDDEDIPKWAKGAVEVIRTLGIVSGRGGNQFIPNETATRAEAIVMLLRVLEVWDTAFLK